MERKTYETKTKEEWLELRARDLTSTDVSALFGISPYSTQFELWHQKKKSQVVQIDENERMKWGSRLEAAIAQGIATDNGWMTSPKKEYINIPALRIGSSFDYECEQPGKAREGKWLLEVKNVDSLIYKDGWEVDGENVEAPPHIEMQLQHQMLVSGYEEAYIGALIGGNKVTLIHRKADPDIHKAILSKTAQFWDSIDKNQEPSPDFIKDAGFISSLYGYAEPGKVLDAADNPAIERLIETYKTGKEAVKKYQEGIDSIKAQLLTMIGDAEKVKGDGFSIAANIVGETKISYTRKSYRNFRVFFKKEK